MALRLRNAAWLVASSVHWSEKLLTQVFKSAPDIPETEVKETTRRDPETHLQVAQTGMQHNSKERTRWLTLKQGAAKIMVDYAYSLLNQRGKKSTKENFESMRQAFLRARSALVDTPDSSLLQNTSWGLMLVEIDLSCCTSFEISEKEQHLGKAERWNNELVRSQQQSSSATIKAQIMIGQHMIKGIKATLQSKRPEGDKDKAKKSLSDAFDGLERELKELQRVDIVSYDEFGKIVSTWRKILLDDIC